MQHAALKAKLLILKSLPLFHSNSHCIHLSPGLVFIFPPYPLQQLPKKLLVPTVSLQPFWDTPLTDRSHLGLVPAWESSWTSHCSRTESELLLWVLGSQVMWVHEHLLPASLTTPHWPHNFLVTLRSAPKALSTPLPLLGTLSLPVPSQPWIPANV